MAKSDWTIVNSNYTWSTDYSRSTSHSLKAIPITGTPMIEYPTSIKDGRTSGFCRSNIAVSSVIFRIYLRYVDANNYYLLDVSQSGSASYLKRIHRLKAGVSTQLYASATTASPFIGTFGGIAFETKNSGATDIELNIYLWDGSAWALDFSYLDNTTAGVDSAGKERIQWVNSYIDDALVEEIV